MLLPTDRTRVITHLNIFSFHCLHHIMYHSINNLLICNLSLQCICNLWSGMYQNQNIIFIKIIDKEIINGKTFCGKTKCSSYPVADIPHPTLVKYLSRDSGREKHVSMPLSEGQWSRSINGNQGIVQNTIYPHFHSPKATHKGKIQAKTWSDFLYLCQEDPNHLCTRDGNTNKGWYLPTDTYIGIFSVPDLPVYLVIRVTPPLTHPLWYDDLHLSGAYVCFPTQVRLFCLTKPYFSKREHTIFVGLFFKICNTPPCSPKYDCNIWLYSNLTEEYFNGTIFFQNQHLDSKNTQIHG